MASSTSFEHHPRNVTLHFFDAAKFWWSASLSLKVFSATLGILVLWGNIKTGLAYAYCLLLIGILSELLQWRSDVQRSRAESLTRKIELEELFAWPVSPSEYSDHLMMISKRRRDAISKEKPVEYFASKQEPGARRALECIQESAWWSKHLSHTMGGLTAACIALLLLFTLSALVLGVSTVESNETLQSVSRVAIAFLAMVSSLGLIKVSVSYFGFSKKSDQAERSASQLLKVGTYTEAEALKVVHDYQIARAASQPIPSWMWKRHRDSLNELWQTYRAGFGTESTQNPLQPDTVTAHKH